MSQAGHDNDMDQTLEMIIHFLSKLILPLFILGNVIILWTCEPAKAGWIKDLCTKYLIADDPKPYAEETTERLLMFKPDVQMLEELDYRWRRGRLTFEQSVRFRHLMEDEDDAG